MYQCFTNHRTYTKHSPENWIWISNQNIKPDSNQKIFGKKTNEIHVYSMLRMGMQQGRLPTISRRVQGEKKTNLHALPGRHWNPPAGESSRGATAWGHEGFNDFRPRAGCNKNRAGTYPPWNWHSWLENPPNFDGIYQETWGFSWAFAVSFREGID